MFTKSALLDLHELTHRGTTTLFHHCDGFSAEELTRAISGFGTPTIQRQLHHIVEAEHFWVDILEDRFKDYDRAVIEADLAWKEFPTVELINEYRSRVIAATVNYISSAAEDVLNTSAEFRTWPDSTKMLIPARVILRVTTHSFNHRGQVAAMCRILGRPVPPLDIPVD